MKRLLLFFVLMGLPAWAVAQEEAAGESAESTAQGITNQLAKAIEDGTLSLSFRYRYEFVDQDSFDKDAHSNTLRTRLVFAPKLNDDWSFLLNFDDVRHIGSAKFNDTRNGKTERPLAPDPKGTDLNQAAVKFTGLDKATIVLGRQAMPRYNKRFIGGVEWRQNEQTFDSVSIDYDFTDKFTGFYSYVAQVNRIFGPDTGTPPEDLDTSLNLLDATYTFAPEAVLTGYGYFLDFDDADNLSNQTLGARLTGSFKLQEDLNLAYATEYAYQEDFGDNPVSYDANYYLVEAGLNWDLFGIKVGYEVLEGGDAPGEGFRTPLATLHAFEGWADKFVGVSTNGSEAGVEDTYVVLTANLLKGKWTLVYHDFSGESGGGDLGTEIDGSAAWSFLDHYGVLVKFASYDADNFSDDTTKFWLQLTANF